MSLAVSPAIAGGIIVALLCHRCQGKEVPMKNESLGRCTLKSWCSRKSMRCPSVLVDLSDIFSKTPPHVCVFPSSLYGIHNVGIAQFLLLQTCFQSPCHGIADFPLTVVSRLVNLWAWHPGRLPQRNEPLGLVTSFPTFEFLCILQAGLEGSSPGPGCEFLQLKCPERYLRRVEFATTT